MESPNAMEYKETKTVEKSVSAEISDTKETVTHRESGSRINISNMHLHFDIRELEDLKFIKYFVEDLKNMGNQDNDEPESEPEYVF